jgi:hypothetical protein
MPAKVTKSRKAKKPSKKPVAKKARRASKA